MAKKELSQNPILGSGTVLGPDSLGHITGRVLTIIDSLGLPEKQCEAIKGLIRQAIFADEAYYQYIDADLHALIYKATIKAKKADAQDFPASLITFDSLK